MMIKNFDKLKSELKKLPEKEQNEWVENWLDEIRWSAKFENSQSELEILAAEASEEYKKGQTKDF